MLYTASYVSVPTTFHTSLPNVFEKIALVSISRNSGLDITGLLISTSKYYAQFIEGPSSSIDEVMGSICSDARHRDITIAGSATREQRLFPGWQMAQFSGENFAKIQLSPIMEAVHRRKSSSSKNDIDRLFKLMARANFRRQALK
ncbi:hypothetical protein GGQ88_003879 [Novosphingobium hassiacum]|uniref:BLUF domain-containing protein n=1 Tax=Novosphingobium hassiacum TaxID=173676 RepID=A0A7W6EXP4_9SPHN|nr:hypothetical protein [Novosphingobium hassiacum]